MKQIKNSGRVLFQGRFTTVNELSVENTADDSIVPYEVVSRKNAVAAIVKDPVRNLFLFVRQFRPGAGKELIELVAGMIDHDHDSPESTITREIEEELGYSVRKDSLRLLETFYSSPGGFTEKIFLYYAETETKTGEGGGIENETIEIVEMTHADVLRTMFEDAKTVVGKLYIKEGLV